MGGSTGINAGVLISELCVKYYIVKYYLLNELAIGVHEGQMCIKFPISFLIGPTLMSRL